MSAILLCCLPLVHLFLSARALSFSFPLSVKGFYNNYPQGKKHHQGTAGVHTREKPIFPAFPAQGVPFFALSGRSRERRLSYFPCPSPPPLSGSCGADPACLLAARGRRCMPRAPPVARFLRACCCSARGSSRDGEGVSLSLREERPFILSSPSGEVSSSNLPIISSRAPHLRPRPLPAVRLRRAARASVAVARGGRLRHCRLRRLAGAVSALCASCTYLD